MESFQCMDKFQSCLEQFQSNIMLAMYIISVLYIVCFYIVTRHLYKPISWSNRRSNEDKKVKVSRGLFILQIILLSMPIVNMILISTVIIIWLTEMHTGEVYYENRTIDKPLWIVATIGKIVNWLNKPI